MAATDYGSTSEPQQHMCIWRAGAAAAAAAQGPEGLDHRAAQGPEPWHTAGGPCGAGAHSQLAA